MDEISLLNKLKSLILLKTGIRTITPADCKRISIEISKKLNKRVSETTIKRLFGFAATSHKFSKFTLLTLAEYAQDDQSNLDQINFNREEQSLYRWEEIHDNATKITQHTLSSCKYRSGVPYEMTVSRKFAEYDLDEFFTSDCTFSSFVSHAGYGKTILLTHLADKIINDKSGLYKDSTILFIKINSIFNNEMPLHNLEELLKSQLGIHPKESLIEFADHHYESTSGKFIIFLDGFSELISDRARLFESIVNFICSLEERKSIKMVISMRPTNWAKFHEYIRQSAYLKIKWFAGSYFDSENISNVPQLTDQEVDLILSKDSSIDISRINFNLKAQLRIPFQIQFYLQLREEDRDFSYATNITIFELASRYVIEKIYKTNDYTEKLWFLKKIILLSDYAKKGTSVPKDKLLGDLLAFKKVYLTLLSEGVLVEEKSFNDGHPREYVRFYHLPVFEYFVFVDLLERFDSRIDCAFFNYLDQEYNGNLGFQLLQWSLRFVIKTDLEGLTHFFKLGLNNYEKKYLILFIAENLDFRNKISPGTSKLLRKHKLHGDLLKVIVNLDFIDTYHKNALDLLINWTDEEDYLVSYHSLLLIFDILSLKSNLVQNRAQLLSKLSTRNRPVNPYKIALLINSKLMGKQAEGRPAIHQFLQYMTVQEPLQEPELKPEDAVSYLLMMLLIIFYGEEEDLLNVTRLIFLRHPKVQKRSPFSVLMMSIFNYANIFKYPGKNTNKLTRLLVMLNDSTAYFKVPHFSGALIKTTQALQAKNEGNYKFAYELGTECLEFFKKNGLHLNVLVTYKLIIEILEETNDQLKVNDYKYEQMCFIEDNKISKQYK